MVRFRKSAIGKLQSEIPLMSKYWEKKHPLLPLVSREMVEARRGPGESTAACWERLNRERDELIDREVADPLKFGHEPKVWKIADALLGLPRNDKHAARPWCEEQQEIRARFGLRQPLDVLLLNGGYRASKTDYAAKRTVQALLREKLDAWCFMPNVAQSIQVQQPAIWKYFPNHLRADRREKITYIVYKLATGFSENRFCLPNSSRCGFRTYEQNEDSVEGAAPAWVWLDEPPDPGLVKAIYGRIAENNGKLLMTFAPKHGYTGVVREFLDGAKVAAVSAAYLVPKDGGQPDVERMLRGTPPEEWQLVQPDQEKPKVFVDMGRRFDVVPRVIRCVNDTRGILFYNTSDNPYGNPRNVFEQMKADPAWFIKERFYGEAHKEVTALFPRFSDRHIIAPNQVPGGGTNYMICDPCSEARNFVFAWVRVTEDHRFYFYREWPNQVEEMPGVGFMGAWAEIGNGKPGERDGKRGPGQRSIGLSLVEYKRDVIARVERWQEYLDWIDGKFALDQRSDRDLVASWPDYNAKRKELVSQRYMDSRFGNTGHVTDEGGTTLIKEFDELGVTFLPTSSDKRDSIREGCKLIDSLLAYDVDKPMDFLNRPHMFFSSDCQNIIFAMRNYTGADGKTGAVKDFVDLVRYPVLLHLMHLGDKQWETEGGGHY